MYNKKAWVCLVHLLFSLCVFSQEKINPAFVGTIYNEEFNVHIVMNFIDKNIQVPQQEVFGEVDGYMGCKGTAHIWLIVSSEVNGKTAHIQMINNYGSEDISASLTVDDNGSYTFKHLSGSTLKFPVGQKWHKVPKKLVFVHQ